MNNFLAGIGAASIIWALAFYFFWKPFLAALRFSV